jgi:hypothetical protein
VLVERRLPVDRDVRRLARRVLAFGGDHLGHADVERGCLVLIDQLGDRRLQLFQAVDSLARVLVVRDFDERFE